MPAALDLTGVRFGRLVAVKRVAKSSQGAVWECLCDCGKTHYCNVGRLRSGNTRSCGCFGHDLLVARNKAMARHGLTGTQAHKAWISMIARCNQESHKYYSHYGARGITVCDRWRTFENFYQDMGEPSKGLSLDRIDNDGIYEPSNCRWATPKQQCRNRRGNVKVTYNGKTANISEWAEITGLERKTLEWRIRRGWDIERSLTTPSLMNRKKNV